MASSYNSILIAALGTLAACAPDQWLIFISTDARVPQFGDRLLVEILHDDGALACDACSRQLGVGEPSQWPVSFGLAAQMDNTGLHIRARLLRADHQEAENPDQAAYLDRVASLPPLIGKTSVHLSLGMNCFGVASVLKSGAFQTCDPATGLPVPEQPMAAIPEGASLPQPDSWQPGKSVDCQGRAPDGMVCVPGGSFVMGSTHYNYLGTDLAAQPEHLVVVKPFFMDVREFTAQDLYRLIKDPKKPYTGSLPMPQSMNPLCTFLNTADDQNNRSPLNCMVQPDAAQICSWLGKRLPTEAEWEYAAGNRHEETIYPWHAPGDVCQQTLVARGFLAQEPLSLVVATWSDCRVTDTGDLLPAGPLLACTDADLVRWPDCYTFHPREETALGIRDLAGNLSEWVADDFASYHDSCWKPGQPGRNWLDNPRCVNPKAHEPGSTIVRPLRGGSWYYMKTGAQVASRYVLEHNMSEPSHFGTGFRCVKDGLL